MLPDIVPPEGFLLAEHVYSRVGGVPSRQYDKLLYHAGVLRLVLLALSLRGAPYTLVPIHQWPVCNGLG